jgi:short-subunit dehydrogenase
MPMVYRTAIITGASSGIGAELARQLAAQGVAVGLTARRGAELGALADSIRAAGGTVATAPADVADPHAFRDAMGELTLQLGPIDLLVANAGVAIDLPADRFSGAEFEQMVRVNLLGAAYAIECVLPEMLRRGRGHLVGVSSLAAFRGLPGAAGYCATKAGLSTLLEGLRVDLRGRGIAVTTVHPGYVHTAMSAQSYHARPFLLTVEPAARIILRGIAARRREVNFPWPLASFMAFARHWPNAIYDRIAARLRQAREPGH